MNYQAYYRITIENPQHHYVKVQLRLKGKFADKLVFFLPSWSPGSYLMREYARHLRKISCEKENGQALEYQQLKKGSWQVNCHGLQGNEEIIISYEVYCHELTVRTSHINEDHAFLHGPSYLIGIENESLQDCEIEFHFPPLWSKITTSLPELPGPRDQFRYKAKNYDHLIDCPVEIGCHETDGFYALTKPHGISNYGTYWYDPIQLKADIEKIVNFIAGYMNDDLPYDQYHFITHFVPQSFGGLEHCDSTVLQFDGRKLADRNHYVRWLQLVAHEYFHTWNVKRIRPVELGPFHYQEENYTPLLWLAEGLTSFMDNYFVYKMQLCTDQEYLKTLTSDFQRYFQTPGKKFDSLEMSSFNAWIKLYRPDENSANSSVSYYLKGGLVFLVLHIMLKSQGADIQQLIHMLWADYKKRPQQGITRKQLLALIGQQLSPKHYDCWMTMIETTEDIDFSYWLKLVGLQMQWTTPSHAQLGISTTAQGQQVVISRVDIDSAAYKSGLNAGDEILAIDDMRVTSSDWKSLVKLLPYDKEQLWIVSRNGYIRHIPVVANKPQRQLKSIDVVDKKLFAGF